MGKLSEWLKTSDLRPWGSPAAVCGGRDIRAMLLSRPTLIFMRLDRITARNGREFAREEYGDSDDPELRSNLLFREATQ
jgi:hypothetical protein